VAAFAVFFYEKMVYIVGRASAVTAVERVFFFINLGQRCLDKGSGGAEQSGNPHPENSSGAAGGNSGNHPDKISHADPGGCGYDEGLNAGN